MLLHFVKDSADRIANEHAKSKGRVGHRISKTKERQFEGQRNPITSKRRTLSIEDVPLAIRGVAGKTLSELPDWLGGGILFPIQQLKEDSRAKGNIIEGVQILIEAINECKN